MGEEPFGTLHDPTSYGRQWHHDYDDGIPPEETSSAVDALERLAAGGPVLEVAAGTGRVAIPLAARGLDVTATDASPDMLARLSRKPGAERVRSRVEVLPEMGAEGPYSLIFIILSSIWVLETAEDQQHFLENAARRLSSGGVLVVESAVADPERWRQPRRVMRGDKPVLVSTIFDPMTQRLKHRFELDADDPHPVRDVYLRFVRPDELLQMAAKACLVPRHTWSHWNGAPFARESNRLIAVLERSV